MKTFRTKKESDGLKVAMYKSSDDFYVAYCFNADRKLVYREEFEIRMESR